MLLTESSGPFSRPDWLLELKLDGFRALALRDSHGARLVSRQGNRMDQAFPEVVNALQLLPADTALDAELVVCDEGGRPQFDRLQSRARMSVASKTHAAEKTQPAQPHALRCADHCRPRRRPLALIERKHRLSSLVRPLLSPTLRCVDFIEAQRDWLYAQTKSLALGGNRGEAHVVFLSCGTDHGLPQDEARSAHAHCAGVALADEFLEPALSPVPSAADLPGTGHRTPYCPR